MGAVIPHIQGNKMTLRLLNVSVEVLLQAPSHKNVKHTDRHNIKMRHRNTLRRTIHFKKMESRKCYDQLKMLY